MSAAKLVESIYARGASRELVSAVKQGDFNRVHDVWANNISPLKMWDAGYYLAYHAVKNKNIAIAKLLLTNLVEAQNNTKVSMGELLHFATKRGHVEMIDFLLSEGVHVDTRDTCGWTPLHTAITYDHKSISLLLARGASIDVKDNDGYTPIHHAIMEGYRDVVRMLLARKLNVDITNEDDFVLRNMKLLYSAAAKEILETEYFRNRYKEHALRDAVCGRGKRNRFIVKSFLKYGLVLSLEDVNDREFLIAAVENEHVKIVEELLKFGADVNRLYRSSRFGNMKMTLLHIAAGTRRTDMVQVLIRYNADVNARDKENLTPIHYAVLDDNFEMVQLFLANGATVQDQPELLAVAAERNCKEILQILKQ